MSLIQPAPPIPMPEPTPDPAPHHQLPHIPNVPEPVPMEEENLPALRSLR